VPVRGLSQVFSPDYNSARTSFQEAARRHGFQLFSLGLAAKGPEGEDLTIDMAWAGAENPRRVFIHSSGVHGVEAFAGSAIQIQWMRKGVTPVANDDAIVLVHALNPYGMAWLRRFNENNVDLNRNFREPGEYKPDPTPYWDTVDKLLNPPDPPRYDWFYLRAAWLVLCHGMPTLRQAVAGGQCLNPKGLFYGGGRLEEGPAKFQEFMRQRLTRAERIVAIDIHTGLGRFGDDRLLVDARTNMETLQQIRDAFGERVEGLSKEGVAYEAMGTHDGMYVRSFPRAKIHFITQEFGTYNALRVVAALREENRTHHYGRDGRAAKNSLLEVFNPRSEAWRDAVLKRGDEVIEQALRLAFEPSR
jgi:predicted deacylase